MPTTVNGIGTHYYGKSEVESRAGTCRNCGAHVTLQSYTTRLWFVIVFIPIIPLKRVRLLDYCPRCSRHWVANPEQYEVSRQLAVSGAMEKYREHPSVDAALMVHAQLLTFHMHSDADKFREAVTQQFPESAELRAGLGQHLDQTGRWVEATPLYEKAFAIDSTQPEVRASLAWRRTNEKNKLDEAYELLDFMRQPGAGQSFNLGQLETLAQAYQKVGNHERALEIFAILLREIPTAGERYEFRKLVSKSERALHRTASLLPEKSFSIRGLFDAKSGTTAPWVRWTTFAVIFLVLFSVGMAGLNEYNRTHRTLQVVSGFAQPVSVSVDGGPAVTVAQRTPFPISEGSHRISVTGAVSQQSDIVLRSNYWTRWTYSPTWIFNVASVAPVTITTLHYAANPRPSETMLLTGSELSFVPHVDYLFEQPPATIKVEGRDKTVSKVQVAIETLSPTTTFLNFSNHDDQAIAMVFAEGWLERNRNDAVLLSMYADRIKGEENQKRVTEFLKQGLWRKPISIAWHRQYQNLKPVAAAEADLVAEYDAQLQQTPNDAGLIYLRGRIGPNRADQLEHYRRANEQDPKLGWPSMALAYDAANRGEWREARDWCEKAVSSLRTDPSFRGLWHIVRLANGEAAAMEGEYRSQINGQDYAEVIGAIIYLIDSLAAQDKSNDARQITRDWLTRMAGPSAPPEALSSFDPLLDYVCGNFDGIRQRVKQTAKPGPSDFHFHGLLAIGQPDVATKSEGFDEQNVEWNELLALSVSYALSDHQTEAETWRTRACDKLREGDSDQKRAATLLQKDQAPSDQELDEVALRISDSALLLTALGQRFPDARTQLYKRAERLNVSRLPPYLLVKKAIDQQ